MLDERVFAFSWRIGAVAACFVLCLSLPIDSDGSSAANHRLLLGLGGLANRFHCCCHCPSLAGLDLLWFYFLFVEFQVITDFLKNLGIVSGILYFIEYCGYLLNFSMRPSVFMLVSAFWIAIAATAVNYFISRR